MYDYEFYEYFNDIMEGLKFGMKPCCMRYYNPSMFSALSSELESSFDSTCFLCYKNTKNSETKFHDAHHKKDEANFYKSAVEARKAIGGCRHCKEAKKGEVNDIHYEYSWYEQREVLVINNKKLIWCKKCNQRRGVK